MNRRHALHVGTLAGKRIVKVPMPKRDHGLISRTEPKIETIAAHQLALTEQRILALLPGRSKKAAGFAKADTETVSEADLRKFLAAIDDDLLDWSDEARSELRELLAAIASERATTSLESLTAYLGDRDAAAAVTQANERAIAWAQARVGNLITEVSETTRDAVNEMTATAIEAGWTNRELADELDAAWEFGADRALLIARTEPTFAETAGTLAGYRESGVVEGKGWSGEDPCDLCQDNEADGIIPLDDDFSSGDDGPPGHPRCECTVYAAVLVGDDQEGGGDE